MSSQPLADKVALITGASKGIGKATALRLGAEGARVAITYRSDEAGAAELIKILGGPSQCLAIKSNAGSLSDIESLVAEVVKAFGKIDILVPNAAILPVKDLASTTEDDFDQAFTVNVKGAYFLAQKAAPYLAAGSHIIFLSTSLTSASIVPPNQLLYNCTKGAIEQITRVIAKDLGRKGIIVNAVAPGPVGTESFYRGKTEETLRFLRGLTPFGRLGEPEEVADTIAFMAKTVWVSGQILRVNGAYVL